MEHETIIKSMISPVKHLDDTKALNTYDDLESRCLTEATEGHTKENVDYAWGKIERP